MSNNQVEGLKVKHLKKDTIAFCEGVYLRWNGKQFVLDEISGAIYVDGLELECDEETGVHKLPEAVCKA